ncbi:MAG: LysE family translocator [Thermodesulfobacteriota bacterium]
MLTHLLLGGGFALAAAIQPGPLQTFLLASVARNGWRRTLPAALSPILSDGPIALLVLFLLDRLPLPMQWLLQALGGTLLLFFAWASYRQWQSPPAADDGDGGPPRTLLQATTVNLLNPNPYLGWSLVLGPAVLTAWEQDPMQGIALIIAFYATMVSVLAATILLFGTSGFLNAKNRRSLLLFSAGALLVIGLSQLARAAAVLLNGSA